MIKKIYRRNPEHTTREEVIYIGYRQILDGVISVLTNGRYRSSYSSDAMEDVILAGIKRRRRK